MNILVITGCLYTKASGPFLSVQSMVIAMLENGHHVTVLGSRIEASQSPTPEGYHALLKKYPNLKVVALRKYGPFHLHFTPSMMKETRRLGPFDLISLQVLWSWNVWRAFWYGYKKRIPTFLSVRGEFNDTESLYSLKKRLLFPWIRFMMEKVSLLHVLNSREKGKMLEFGLKNKISVIGNGVFILDQNPFNNQNKNILFLGRLHAIKNILAMVEAWKKVDNRGYKLIIAGEGGEGGWDYEKKVKKAAEGIESIELPGPLFDDDKVKAFKNSSWFILPSLNEGMPMAALEAMSYGVPVILSKECNLNEVVDAGAGVYSGHSPDEIASAFERVINMDEPELLQMSDTSFKIMKEDFNWIEIAKKLVQETIDASQSAD